jgi:hypothetical protein
VSSRTGGGTCKAQPGHAKLSGFLPVSKPALDHFKAPRTVETSGAATAVPEAGTPLEEDSEVSLFDESKAWWPTYVVSIHTYIYIHIYIHT